MKREYTYQYSINIEDGHDTRPYSEADEADWQPSDLAEEILTLRDRARASPSPLGTLMMLWSSMYPAFAHFSGETQVLMDASRYTTTIPHAQMWPASLAIYQRSTHLPGQAVDW